ncbi:MAG: hypothetical protein RRY07_04425 [Bacteroidaceae bacterium]
MEQIIVTHPDASTILLVSKGRTSGVTKAEQTVALLGADTVAITVKTATPINFYLGDQIEVYGKVYTLNQLPTIKKTDVRKFEYDLTFEGVQYELIDAQWLLPDNTVLDSFTGDLADYLGLLTNNANRVFPGKWQPGTYPANTEYKTLTYTRSNCLEVLQNLCEEYNTEFEISQANGIRTINIKTAGVNFPYTFRYGRTGGLYELSRQNINSKNVVTRLYVYGGSNNLGDKYRYTKLCLSGKGKNASYIENAAAIAAFGLKENTKTFDDVYPNRYGVVSSLGSKYYAFVDNTMNFDLNEKESDGTTTKWLISGVNAKVKMTSGNLAGYEFEIHKYTHSTKEIQVVPFTEENGMKFPSETSAAFQFGVGDKYIFTDINLPDAYKTEAEAKLQEEGETYYNQYCQPQVQYNLSIDQNYIKQFAGQLTVVNLFAVGDYIPVEDTDIGVNKSIRITGFTRDLLQPYKYSLTLGDSVTKTTITRVIEDLQKIDTVIQINDLANPSKARRNWRAAQEVLANVFDPDGNYYSEKIKPLSIETTMLAVGAKSMQFVLKNVVFTPNYNGKPNYLAVSSGILVHYTIKENIRSWNLAAASFSNLVGSTSYYIYARCTKNNAANIVLDTKQIKVDSDPLFYHFLIGTLSSVITDEDGKNPARLLSLTYGASTINGRFISTGRIQSSGGGTTYFDLDAGEIGGKIKFVASDGSTKNVSDLDNVALETKDYINNTLPGVLSDMQKQLDGQIEQFFETYDPTTINAPANTWTTTVLKEYHLEDLFYNTTSGAVFRWIKNGNDYSWSKLADAEVAQALALANDAIALAATKRRIFTATPYPPYEIGDLWVQGASGDIMRCKATRTSGSYSSGDWEKASNYTNDAALTAFINGSYATTVTDLTNQLDGKIESWFQTNDPSTDWTTPDLKAKHVGDMWYNSTKNELKRYSNTYAWVKIEDKKAIDAYNAASKAQDTADKKRQVFTETPYPPYDIGDLWLKDWTDNGVKKQELYRCLAARSTGLYTTNDWVVAVYYDNTKATIDASIVTSGTVQLAGSDASIKAGITGDGTVESSVRFWAGASKENRATAPYRVLQDGTAVMSKAEVTGKINANSGAIGGFEIGDGRIGTKLTGDAEWTNTGASFYKNMLRIADVGKEVSIGTSIGPSIFPNLSQLGFFKNTKSNNEVCKGVKFLIAGEGTADTNIALYGCGNYVTNGIVCGYELDNNYINLSTASTLVRDYKFHQFYLVKSTVTHPFFALPNRIQVAKELGIKGDEPFAVKVTYISDKDNTTVWTLYGRSEDLFSDTRPLWDNHYPRIVDNGDFNYNKIDLPKGAKAEFFLTYNPKAAREDMTYYAYLLNFKK